jgi:uncharacterized protein (TIGR03086 family)
MLDLEPAAREVVRLLEGITDDRLADPTPCADRSVAALLDHLMGLSLAFTWAAHKTTTTEGGANPGPGEASAEHLDPGWRTILPRRLFELVEAWRDPEGLAGSDRGRRGEDAGRADGRGRAGRAGSARLGSRPGHGPVFYL